MGGGIKKYNLINEEVAETILDLLDWFHILVMMLAPSVECVFEVGRHHHDNE